MTVPQDTSGISKFTVSKVEVGIYCAESVTVICRCKTCCVQWQLLQQCKAGADMATKWFSGCWDNKKDS